MKHSHNDELTSVTITDETKTITGIITNVEHGKSGLINSGRDTLTEHDFQAIVTVMKDTDDVKFVSVPTEDPSHDDTSESGRNPQPVMIGSEENHETVRARITGEALFNSEMLPFDVDGASEHARENMSWDAVTDEIVTALACHRVELTGITLSDTFIVGELRDDESECPMCNGLPEAPELYDEAMALLKEQFAPREGKFRANINPSSNGLGVQFSVYTSAGIVETNHHGTLHRTETGWEVRGHQSSSKDRAMAAREDTAHRDYR